MVVSNNLVDRLISVEMNDTDEQSFPSHGHFSLN